MSADNYWNDVLGLTSENEWPEDPEPIIRAGGTNARFATESLPTVVRAWAEAVTLSLETPQGMAPLTALGLLAASTLGKIHVQVNPDFIVPCNLYVAPIGSSGERKSPLLRAGMGGLYAAQELLIEAHKRRDSDALEAKVRRKQAQAMEKELVKNVEQSDSMEQMLSAMEELFKAADVLDPGPEPRLWSSDVTAEQLENFLESHKGRFAVLSDEGGTLGTLGRYQKGDANLDVLLKGHDGGTVYSDRTTRQVHVKNAYVTMLIMLQPWQLSILASREFSARGLAARFLYAWSPSNVGYRKLSGPPIPIGIRTAFDDLIERIVVHRSDDDLATVLICDQEAREVLAHFVENPVDGIERRMRLSGDLHDETLRAWGSKLPGQVARIAGLIHISDPQWESVEPYIGRETMTHACNIGRSLIPHAIEALHVVQQQAWVSQAMRLVSWLKESEWPTVFNLREWYRSANIDSDDAKVAIEKLVIRGWLRPISKVKKAGRPPMDFETHPDIKELDPQRIAP